MPDSSRKHRSILSAEVLEARQLLSTVSIQATGFTGEEVMVVTDAETGDQLFGTRVFETGTLAATRNNTFTFEVDDSVKLTDLRINFVNDFLREHGCAMMEFKAAMGEATFSTPMVTFRLLMRTKSNSTATSGKRHGL